MRNTSLFIAFGSLVAIAVLPRCGDGTTDCTQTSTCPSDASDGPPPVSCDTTKDPKDQPGCLDNRVGVFVDVANGKDTNAGTKEAPFQTIGKAITSVGALTRVYICEGIYPEDVAITPPVDGISLYGGFKCVAWTYTGNQPQVGKSQVALKITGTTKAFTIQDLLFHAADGSGASSTSIGALVANAAGGITFNRVNLVAGVGSAGTDGADGANYSALLQNDPLIAGNSATGGGTKNGAEQLCANLCTDSKVGTGGAGGIGGTSTQGGASGDATPVLTGTFPNDGAGGNGGNTCTNGDNGASATIAGVDAPAPATTGTLAETGWTPTPSVAGKNGGTGQGGGGGGGTKFADNSAGGGGGGGCGGCGGGGGGAGASGGSSVALAVLSSNVTVNSSQLHASDGGNGGKGKPGQAGQNGGFKGKGSTPGCDGGNGGNGSAGGAGAGGVGGLSVGVLYKGTQPNLDGTTTGQLVVGKAGTKGTGGNAGANDGIDGVAQPFLAAP